MKQAFLPVFLILTLSHPLCSMEMKPTNTPQDRQKLRNQLAFASVCQEDKLAEYGYLFTDGSTNLNYLYKDSNTNLERTALSIAARKYTYPVISGDYYNPNAIKWLIDNKADLTILDESGRSAALWSIGSFQGENEHPITLFLETKLVNVNQIYDTKNIDDFFQIYEPKVTLLTAAVLNNWQMFGYSPARYNLVRTLLKFNPNRNLAPNGKTALQIAEELQDAEMVKILKEE